MMKLAGLPETFNPEREHQHFMQQASAFESLDYDFLNKWMKIFVHLHHTHPWTVMRASELIKWTESGEYQQVLERETRGKVTRKVESGVLFCRNCEYRLDGSETYCPSCGKQLG